jgi:hypothetical protein
LGKRTGGTFEAAGGSPAWQRSGMSVAAFMV